MSRKHLNYLGNIKCFKLRRDFKGGTPLAHSNCDLGEFMKTLTQTLILAFTTSLLFVNCGSPSSSGDGFGAVVDSTNNSSNSTDTTALLTNCSRSITAYDTTTGARVPTTDISVVVQRYKDQFGATRDDLMRVKFVTAPSSQWINENWDLEIYRWIASSNGSTLDSTNLSFQFERKVGSNAQLVSSNNYIFFNWAEFVGMADYVNKLPAYSSSPQISSVSPIAFFNDMNLLVNTRDASNSYQVMRLVLRRSSTGQSVREIDVLIPSFQADPAKYAADSRHPQILSDLHPLKGQVGFTQLQFQSVAHGACFLPGAI
jgi:hypothetical protein